GPEDRWSGRAGRESGEGREDALGGLQRDGRFRKERVGELGFVGGREPPQGVARREPVQVGEEGEEEAPAITLRLERIGALGEARALVSKQRRGAGVVKAGRRLARVRLALRPPPLVREPARLVRRGGRP